MGPDDYSGESLIRGEVPLLHLGMTRITRSPLTRNNDILRSPKLERVSTLVILTDVTSVSVFRKSLLQVLVYDSRI